MMKVLRNNVRKVLYNEPIVVLMNEEQVETRLLIRESKTNSSTDMMMFEIVLSVPDVGMYQLFTSEGYHKFDADNNTRNFREAYEITFNKVSKIALKISGMLIDDIISDLMPTRMCNNFDITSDVWTLGATYDEDLEGCGRYFIYGNNQAWDFGSDKEKAEKHLSNLCNKGNSPENEEE